MHSWIWSFLSAVFVLTLNPYYSPLCGESKWDISETELFSPSKDLLAPLKSNQCRWLSFFSPSFPCRREENKTQFICTLVRLVKHIWPYHTHLYKRVKQPCLWKVLPGSWVSASLKPLQWLGLISVCSLFHTAFSVALTLDLYPAAARLIHHSD